MISLNKFKTFFFEKVVLILILAFVPAWCGLEKNVIKRNFTHIDLGASNLEYNSLCIVPTIGIGRDIAMGASNLDFSMNFGYSDKAWFLNFPKIMYVHFFSALNFNTAYFSAGSGWFYLQKKDRKEKFSGLPLHIAIGYQFNRSETILEILELSLTQPIITATRNGKFPAPILIFSLGIGF